MGIGGILLDETAQKIIDSFGFELSHEYLQSEYGTSDCSNPTAEMIAVSEALQNWSDHFKSGDEVEIRADYMGVREWNTGGWKINKPYIKKAKEQIADTIKNNGLRVTWTWVKGHQTGPSLYGSDKYWNDKVDKLAKGQ
jgi:ribonuclease HI